MTDTKEKGWIKVDRSITMVEYLWKSEERFDNLRAWLDILISVNYTTKMYALGEKSIKIEPGCILTSVLKLSNRWHWNRRTVSKFLNLLRSSGMIKYERCGKGILIKVLSEDAENVHISKTAQECDESYFFCPSDAQDSTQDNAQEYTQDNTQDSAQMCSTTKESNKDNKVLEREKERKEEAPTASAKKIKYSENIFLSPEEYDKLVLELGEADANVVIGIVDDYKRRTGKFYESDYLAIKAWGIKALGERRNRTGARAEVKKDSFDLLKTDNSESLECEFENLMLERMAENA